MFEQLPDGFVDYATFNLKEILQLFQKIIGMLMEGW